MAKPKLDNATTVRLDQFEQAMIDLKLAYEKYFMGIERFEPAEDREKVKRMLLDFMRQPPTNTRAAFRYNTLRQRHSTLEMYLQRNLVQIERGTHPKMKFRSDMHERHRAEDQARATARVERQVGTRNVADPLDDVVSQYFQARTECGIHSKVKAEAIKEKLSAQAEAIKKKYNCKDVQFKVKIEDGQPKLKAVPVR